MEDSELDAATIETLRRVLAEHGVSFAVLFGSGARGSMDEDTDLDVAVEFEALSRRRWVQRGVPASDRPSKPNCRGTST